MGDMAHVVVCVDDTDDLTKKTSTGAIAEALAEGAREMGGAVDAGVTRHQLLLDPRVPYTSHNSAMAFTATLPEDAVEAFEEDAAWVVRSMMAPTANPGMALGVVPDEADGALGELVGFGLKAQKEYLEPRDAFSLAERIPWLRLRALGGTGWGVIGALAGAGLRLYGNDGRFRGSWDLSCGFREDEGRLPTLARVRAELEGELSCPVAFAEASGKPLDDGERVAIVRDAKALMRAGAFVVVVAEEDGVLRPFSKRDFDERGEASGGAFACEAFSTDNDREEFLGASSAPSCLNCLYRRLTPSGYACVGGKLSEREGAAA